MKYVFANESKPSGITQSTLNEILIIPLQSDFSAFDSALIETVAQTFF